MNTQQDYYADQPKINQLFSIDSEQTIIGIVLIEPSKLHDTNELSSSDFYDNSHVLIFDAFNALADKNSAIDIVIVAEHLDRRGLLEKAGGLDYLLDITKNTPTTSTLDAHVLIVKNKAKERRLLGAAQEIQNAILADSDSTTEEKLSKAEEIFTSANSELEAVNDSVDMSTAVKDYVKFLSWRFENEGIQGIKTGFTEVDNRLQGMKGGELYIVAARPGMGKTTYATNILANAARQGAKGYFSSLEMPRNQLVQRMIASTGNIPLSALKDASVLSCSELSAKVTMAVALVKDMDITIDDQGGVDIADIRSRSRAKYRKGGLDLLLIDYLQLIDDRTAKSRFDVVSAVSRKLKALAKELDIPIIALSQLSRAVEQRTDKRPILSDLRESGQIEQDADVIQFLYRDEVYNEHTNSKGVCEVDTAKYRDGESGRDFVAFFGAQNRMTDLAPGYIHREAEQQAGKGF